MIYIICESQLICCLAWSLKCEFAISIFLSDLDPDRSFFRSRFQNVEVVAQGPPLGGKHGLHKLHMGGTVCGICVRLCVVG